MHFSVTNLYIRNSFIRLGSSSGDPGVFFRSLATPFNADHVHLSSKSPDLGEAEEEIASTYKGEVFAAGFNARYFLDVLSVIETESLSLQMETGLSPCLIQEQGNPSFKAVVMPVKV